MSAKSCTSRIVPTLGSIWIGLLIACSSGSSAQQLGPKDGHDLPPTDLERVSVGELAPDFSLRALSGAVHTLSDYREAKNVVLVFYRGHW